MTTVTQHAPGTFCWVELGTTDQQGAKNFYSALFGWNYEDSPMGPDAIYTQVQRSGRQAAALYRMPSQMLQQGIPPHWLCYVSVASADEAAAKAKQLGGRVIVEPFDAMEHGRMAVLQDPTGATLAVWQAKKHIGVSVLGEPGALCWAELGTNDPNAAGVFYAGLFGWTLEKWPSPPEYTLFKRGDSSAGGMYTLAGDKPGMSSHWMAYFAVENCDGCSAKVEQLGGEVVSPPRDVPGVGCLAVLRDPQGAVFSVIQPKP